MIYCLPAPLVFIQKPITTVPIIPTIKMINFSIFGSIVKIDRVIIIHIIEMEISFALSVIPFFSRKSAMYFPNNRLEIKRL